MIARRGSSVMILPRERELKPVEAVPGQSQQVRKLPDWGGSDAPHALDRRSPDEPPQVKLRRLRKSGQVVDAEHSVRRLVLLGGAGRVVFPDEGEHARVGRVELVVGAEAEDRMLLPDLD